MMKFASTTAVAALLFTAPAFAQTAPSTSPTAPGSTTTAPATPAAPATIQYIQTQGDGQWLASNVMGETVRSPSDEKIGDVNNLLMDKDGRVLAAVIGVGGFLGIGEKDVAVPFNALQLSNEPDGRITLAATKDELKNAPDFKDLSDQDRDNRAAQTGMPASSTATGTPAQPAQ